MADTPRLPNLPENPGGYEVHPDKPGSNTYYVQGCRCDACRYDHADAQARDRKRRSQIVDTLPAEKHGKASTYTNWWCRCVPCREAYVEDRRQRKAAKR